MTISKSSTLSEIEERIKEKMLVMLERAAEEPAFLPDGWSTYFGEASIMRALSIVAKMKGRPADDAETKAAASSSEPMTLEEMRMMRDWLNDEITKREGQ